MNTAFITCASDGAYCWTWRDHQDQPSSKDRETSLSQLAAAMHNQRGESIFLAPADTVALREVEFNDKEKRLLNRTVPFSLEDDLADDIENLHFALGRAEDHRMPVAVIQQDVMSAWLQDFNEAGLIINAVIPEQTLLPLNENGWTLLVDGERWLVRAGQTQGFALEAQSAGLALQLLMDEAEQLPDTLLVVGVSEDAREDLVVQLPELLRARVEWGEAGYWPVIAQANPKAGGWNLLQGDFATSLPFAKMWLQWRTLLILLAVAVTLQLGLNVLTQQQLESENIALRSSIEQTYRSVVPKGAVVDPEKQLRRKVSTLKGSGGGQGFMSMMEKVGAVVNADKAVAIDGINYNEKQGEIRLSLLANEFKNVEDVRSKIQQAGFTAELAGSSADGDKTRARLRIKGQG